MRPTVLTEVSHDMLLMTEETFAPIIPVMRYRTDDEAVALANDTHYGLSASVLAGTPEEAARIAERVNAGTIALQDTFLTLFKTRDIGHELVRRLRPRRRPDRPRLDPALRAQEGPDDPVRPARPAGPPGTAVQPFRPAAPLARPGPPSNPSAPARADHSRPSRPARVSSLPAATMIVGL